MVRLYPTLGLSLALLACLVASPAGADERGRESVLAISGDMGMGGLGGAAYATFETGIDIRERALALGLFGRLRLALQDVQGDGRVHSRDWDEASDYVHILRYLQYRHTFGGGAGAVKLEAQEGELLGFTLGHGTLLRDYSNVANPDHPHSGVRLRVEGERLAGEAFVDNFLSPAVVGLRVDGAPAPQLPRLRFGASVVIDPQAPEVVRRGADGLRAVDSAWNLRAETDPLTLLGFEAEYTFGDLDRVRVTPYGDFNTSLHGIGLHTGASARFRVGRRVILGGQLEYRVSSGGYSPAHVETFYDVERYQAALSASPGARATELTKLGGLEAGLYGGHGVLGQLGVEVDRWARVRVGVEHRPGPDATSLWVRASTSPLPRLDLGVLVLARGLGEGGSNGVAAMAEGRLQITRWLYALGQYSRLWSLDSASRTFGILQSFNLSAGAIWSS